MGKRGSSGSKRGEALVALVNNWTDWRILQEQLWYRVPVASAPKRWPPRWMAFYQTKIFRDEAYAVRYFGQVKTIKRRTRRELFPDELPNAKSERVYYQVFLDALTPLPRPIVSLRLRRIVFISTTYHKLATAGEINDLYDDSPLEDALWTELKGLNLLAERQYDVATGGSQYFLDFALFCAAGKIDIETDGDSYHINAISSPADNRRNNALTTAGWRVLRFTTRQVKEEMTEYCVPLITGTVNELGGLEGQDAAPRRYYATEDGIVQQLTLFDGKTAYKTEPPEEPE